ncbi:tryptophan--tRNA ligase [bacterium]|nr:tryptophan--tRNA ligase [bacterium]MBU1024569.1 tryptophan--tRNA ligase [bacterium]
MTEIKKKRVLSGNRPTGPSHLGHLFGVHSFWVGLQDKYDCFFFIADYHALTTAHDKVETIQENIREVTLDMLGAGLTPEKSTIFLQSDIPEVSELNLLMSMIVPMGLLERNPTYKAQLEELNIQKPNLGLFQYPVLQTTDIVIYKGEFVPVGKDQLPHVWIAADIAKTFRHRYGDVFPIPEELVGEYPDVPGIDNRKMSKSYDNTIDVRDDDETTLKKVKQFYTDPTKIRIDDPGHPDECPVYYFHTMVSGKEQCEDVHSECMDGKRGCVQCKKEMCENLNNYLKPVRERRKTFADNPDEVDRVLYEGGLKAREEAQKTLKGVRKAMGLTEKSRFS